MKPRLVMLAIWLLVTTCLAPPLVGQEPVTLKRLSNAQTRTALMSLAVRDTLNSGGQLAAGLPRGVPLFTSPTQSGPVRVAVAGDWLFVWSAEGEKYEKAPLIQAGRGPTPSVFGPSKVKTAGGAELWLEFVVFPPANNSRPVLTMTAGLMAASVNVDGRRMFIGLADTNFNGTYGDQMRLPLPIFKAASMPHDTIFVDLNGDGNFHHDMEQPAVPLEVMPLGEMVRLGDNYYKLAFATDGTSLTMEKLELPMGTMVASDPSAAIVLASSAGVQSMLAGGSQGWSLPAGEYQPLRVMLGKRDRQGTWTLIGYVPSARARLKVTADETLNLAVGEPVRVKANARMNADRTLTMQYTITDDLGTQYTSASRNGSRLPPPSFVILHESGKRVRMGSFSYG